MAIESGDTLTAARLIATTAHERQVRKYTGDPYVVHCAAVATLVADHGGAEWLQAAAWLHDAIEDTPLTVDELASLLPDTPALGDVLDAVWYMTERDHEGNRKARKAAECARLATGTPDQQALKLADLIDNTSSIVEHDPDFARVYLVEKRALVDALTGAWPSMRTAAERSLTEAESDLGL